MAALLLPRALLADQIKQMCASRGLKSVEAAVEGGDGQSVIRALADLFDVNPVMVFYRLQDLRYLPREASQETLSFAE